MTFRSVLGSFTGTKGFGCILLFSLFFTQVYPVLGQSQLFKQVTKFTTAEGLSSYYVTKINKDRFGFLWVGTQDGLNRFDGQNFLTYGPTARLEHRISGAKVEDIVEDQKHQLLWVLTTYGNLCAISLPSGRVVRIIEISGSQVAASKGWHKSMVIVGGTLWIGGQGGLLAYDLESNRFESAPLVAKLLTQYPTLEVYKIISDGSRFLWLTCGDLGMIRVDLKANMILRLTKADLFYSGGRSLQIWDALKYQNGIAIAANLGGRLIKINSNGTFAVKKPNNSLFNNGEILAVAEVGKDTILFSSPRGLLLLDMMQNRITKLIDQDIGNNWLTHVLTIFPDSAQHLYWLGCQEGLAGVNTRVSAIIPYGRDLASETRLEHLYALYQSDLNTVICGDETGMFKVSLSGHSVTRVSAETHQNLAIVKGGKDVFIAAKSGLYVLRNGGLKKAFLEFPEIRRLNSEQIGCIFSNNDSVVVFSNLFNERVYVWNRFRRKVNSVQLDLIPDGSKLRDNIISLVSAPGDRIWILRERSLVLFDPSDGVVIKRLYPKSREGYPIRNFMDLCRVGNAFVLATYGDGAFLTDSTFSNFETVNQLDRIVNSCIYRLLNIGDSLILMTTNNGLNVFIPKLNRLKTFYQSDGLVSSSFEEYCSLRLKDGRIAAGGVGGFSVIDPALLTRPRESPTPYIRSILWSYGDKVDSQSTGIDSGRFVFPRSTHQLAIYFGSLCYDLPRHIRYRYKVEPITSDWTELTEGHALTLVGLSPGDYDVFLESSSDDDHWSSPAHFSFFFPAEWYETKYFYFLIACFIAAIIFVLIRARDVQRLRRSEIRKGIARDLHDDLGANLNSMKHLTHILAAEYPQNIVLDSLGSAISQTTSGLRDMLWVLDDDVDTVSDLMDRLKKNLVNALPDTGPNVKLLFLEEIGRTPLQKTEKRGILLIGKEALTNSIKHSKCSEIVIESGLINQKLYFLFSDNGKGFVSESFQDHYGLKNLAIRAAQIHYRFSLESVVDQGTRILIQQL